MKDFFKSLFASLIAQAIFLGIGLLILFGLVALVGASASKPQVPSGAVLVFNLSTNIPDAPREDSPGQLIQKALEDRGDGDTPLASLISALDRAAGDDNIRALYLTGNLQPVAYGAGSAALTELREALQRFKRSGKPVIAYNQTWTKKEYYLCAGAGTLYCNPFGEVEMTGPRMDMVFLAGALKKYGVDVQVTRVGKYKSAVEPLILEKMSEPNREQYQKLLDDLWTDWKTVVAKDRKLAPVDLQKLADEKGALLADEALKAGLVDKVAPYDEVLDRLKEITGKGAGDQDFPQIGMAAYAKLPHRSGGRHLVGVIYAEGDIVGGEGQENQVGGERLSRELRRLRLDPAIKAIVLRVNSPGGSADASDLIQREVILARKVKPVVISMGTVAASGGYWISTYGDRIFAEPTTLTGSIGVFGILPNIRKLANEHGVTFDSVQTAKFAMPTLFRGASPEELARIQTLVDHIYDQFLDKVAEGRHLRREQVQEIAQGRVWSGREALKLGLVDELGGLEDAVMWAAKKANLGSDYRVAEPDAPLTAAEKLMKLVNGGGRKPLARGPVQELKLQLEQQLQTLQSLNDPRGIYVRLPLDVTCH